MATSLPLISKEDLIQKFHHIYNMGWIENTRGANDGSVGNMLEDILGIPENNLPIPNAAEWELKAQRSNTSSLLTLFHMEPSPRIMRVVPNILLPKYGWPSEQAGKKYPKDELSFRATLNSQKFSDRGLKVLVNDNDRKIEIQFSKEHIDPRHSNWMQSIRNKVGNLDNFANAPYWGFDDVFCKAGTKLINCFYLQADEKVEKIDGHKKTYFLYNYALKLSHFDQLRFIDAIRNGTIYIDFDARSGHNHGTKFRIRYKDIPSLYSKTEVIFDYRNI